MAMHTRRHAHPTLPASPALSTVHRRLQLSSVPDALPGRERELEQLLLSLRTAIEGRHGKTIYISGETGTGKSAVVRAVMRRLHREYNGNSNSHTDNMDVDADMEQHGGNNVRYCFINAMKLASPKEAYDALWNICSQYAPPDSTAGVFAPTSSGGGGRGRAVGSRRVAAHSSSTTAMRRGRRGNANSNTTSGRRQGRGITKAQIPRHLTEMFANSSSNAAKRPYIIVVIDELDFLVSSKQEEVYQFFNWPQYPNSRLCVIGVANTINLLDDLLPKIASRVEITERITFQTYSFDQIMSILRDRLGRDGAPLIENSALELCARKVGVTFGDIRKGLNICRRAIEIAEEEEMDMQWPGNRDPTSMMKRTMMAKQEGDGEGMSAPRIVVQTRHMDLAFQELYTTMQSYPLTRLPLYHKIFLACAIREQQYLGHRELSFEKLVSRMQNAVGQVYSDQSLPAAQINDILTMVEMLSSLQVLSLKYISTERFPNVELAAEADMMERTLREDPALQPLFAR